MTIEVQPARIVGAEIGDRVTWTIPTLPRYYGYVVGLSTEFPGRIVVNLEAASGACRHIEPERLTLAPKEYAVGDRVSPEDANALPNGTTLIDYGYLPLFKLSDEWYSIDISDPRPVRCLLLTTRTIAWMPRSYTDNT